MGEKQPAEVARSRQARNTRPLLTAESGIWGETRFLGQRWQVSGAFQRECRFLRVRAKECDSDADKCEFSVLHYLRVGVFSAQS